MQRQDPQLCVGFTASIIITLEAGGGVTLHMHIVSVCIMMKSAYYSSTWLGVTRDEPRTSIVPRPSPPPGFDPWNKSI